MFGFIDPAGFMEGIPEVTPGLPPGTLPQGLSPMAFYATTEGSRVMYGGSLDLSAMVAGATSARRR